MVLLLWAVVVFAIAISLGYASMMVKRIVNRARPLDSEDWLTPLWEVSDRLSLDEPPRLLRSEDAKMPFACGVFRPTIVLPSECDTWSLDRRRAVLLHELAHVRRHDLIGHTLGRLACAVHDPANYVFCGYDPWQGWLASKPWLVHFHIKDWIAKAEHGSLAGEGQGRIPEVIADAVKMGYDGFATMEPHLLGGGPTGGVTGPELFRAREGHCAEPEAGHRSDRVACPDFHSCWRGCSIAASCGPGDESTSVERCGSAPRQLTENACREGVSRFA